MELQLPHEIYYKVLKEILEKHLNLSDDDYKLKITEGSSKGDNFNGIIYRIEVFKQNAVLISLIAKIPPQNQLRREEFLIHKMFKQECHFYDSIYPMYRKFQEDKGIDVATDGLHELPFCYKIIPDAPYEGLFFEDLRVKYFETFDRKKDLTKEHVLLVMKTLAKMHATYFALKEQKPGFVEKYKTIEDYILQQCRRKEAAMKVFTEKMKEQALDVLKHCGNEELVKAVRKVLSTELVGLLEEGNDAAACEPYGVLCHGDCWINNVMYRNNKDGSPVECRLIDHSIMRYTSPVTDLLYFIFSSTTKTLRNKHYEEFMAAYYDNLSYFIKRLGSDPTVIYPRHVFEDHLIKFGRFGLAIAIILVPMVTSDSDDMPEIDEVAEAFHEKKEESGEAMNFTSEKTLRKYEDRMIGIFEDMYEYGYI